MSETDLPLPQDNPHALMAGAVMGMLMKYGVPHKMINDDDGNHSVRFELTDHTFNDMAQTFLGKASVTITIVVDPPVFTESSRT